MTRRLCFCPTVTLAREPTEGSYGSAAGNVRKVHHGGFECGTFQSNISLNSGRTFVWSVRDLACRREVVIIVLDRTKAVGSSFQYVDYRN